jgi:CRP-like cAMP-binding protein
MSRDANRPENRLLAALPTEEYQRLLPHIEFVTLTAKQVLHIPGEPVEYVYFPCTGIVSLVNILENGTTIELSLVGNEGMVGIQAFLGDNTMPHQAMSQVSGRSGRIPVLPFKTECDRKETLHNLLLRYTRFLLIETAQGTACNSIHTIDSRLARWLLAASDRLQSNELALTQDLIAQMLGIRRAGVTVAAGTFQQAGMIRYHRGEITILNRDSLKAIACECYQLIKTELDQLMGDAYNSSPNED